MALQPSMAPSGRARSAFRRPWLGIPAGERLNSLTHLFGLALTAAGSVLLISRSTSGGDRLRLLGVSVFSLSMIALYASSTLFHAARGPAKARWAKADHCAIYALIAGTYTPFALITLRGPLGWGLFAVIWALALLGVCKELWWDRGALPAVPLYLLMGWCGLAAGGPLVHRLHGPGWMWLLGGCLLYSFGVLFYARSHRVRHAHGIWHLFVLGGTACHFVTVWRFVA
jgi:hemolysin III